MKIVKFEVTVKNDRNSKGTNKEDFVMVRVRYLIMGNFSLGKFIRRILFGVDF